jgi:hypothetical protein
MIKRIFSMLLCVLLFSATAYAAAPSQANLPEGVTVTDITDRQTGAAYELPKQYPTAIQNKTEDGVKLLLKTFEVASDVSPADLAENGLVQNEVEYVLRDVLRTALPDDKEKKTVSQTVMVSSQSDKHDDIVALLQETLDYSANEFSGQLSLDKSSITTDVEDMESYAYTVTDTREYPGLARNDPALLPKTVEKNGVTLTLADIRWDGGNENTPNPGSYTATVLYRGSANGSRPSGYLATATYIGEVEKVTPGNIVYTLVYAAKPVPVVEEMPEPFNWMPILFGLGGVVVIGGGIVLVFFLRRRKAADYTEEEPEMPKKRMRIPHMLSEAEQNDQKEMEETYG